MNCIHCGKPIDKHEAGRETDECVAKAFGWKYANRRYMSPSYYSPSVWIKGVSYVHINPLGNCSLILTSELIDHLTADDNPVENVMMFWDRSNYKWAIEINMMCKPGSQEWSNYHVTADTLPLALCRAVLTLEAVGASDE